MEQAGIGWIAAIIIGGIAGWLAGKITRSNMGLITNIILGVIGAGIASWLFGLLGIQVGGPGWLGYLIAGFVGACIPDTGHADDLPRSMADLNASDREVARSGGVTCSCGKHINAYGASPACGARVGRAQKICEALI